MVQSTQFFLHTIPGLLKKKLFVLRQSQFKTSCLVFISILMTDNLRVLVVI